MVELIDSNFNLHATRIPSLTKGMVVYEQPNLSYVDSGLSCDTFNIIHITGEVTLDELKQTVDHFRSQEKEFCIWINKENLNPTSIQLFRDLDLIQQNAEEGMVLDIEEYQLVTKEEHSNIRIVDNEESLEKYAKVIAENWSPPDENVITYYNQTAKQYLDQKNRVTLLIYYHEGKPVSTVELFATDDQTIGFYGFATLEAYRGKGIGSTLMTFALNKSKEWGYKNAILQASEDGIGIYRKMGFKEYTTYFEYT